MFWMYSGDLTVAAHVWAAAAGTAGAIAPRHIANALLEGHDLLNAAIEGTRRADAEVEEDWPSPRGCALLVERGVVSLNWETERHRILLSEDAGKWVVEIHCRHVCDCSTICDGYCGSGCERRQVAEAVQRLWEEHGAMLRGASSGARHGLARAATLASRMINAGEIPGISDIVSSGGLHAIWGMAWSGGDDDAEAKELAEAILGYTPCIVPAAGDPAAIVIRTPPECPGRDTRQLFQPSGTMAAVISWRLGELGRPEFTPTIRALDAAAGLGHSDIA